MSHLLLKIKKYAGLQLGVVIFLCCVSNPFLPAFIGERPAFSPSESTSGSESDSNSESNSMSESNSLSGSVNQALVYVWEGGVEVLNGGEVLAAVLQR